MFILNGQSLLRLFPDKFVTAIVVHEDEEGDESATLFHLLSIANKVEVAEVEYKILEDKYGVGKIVMFSTYASALAPNEDEDMEVDCIKAESLSPQIAAKTFNILNKLDGKGGTLNG